MDNVEQMVRLVTDRLLEKLQENAQQTVAYIGNASNEVQAYVTNHGYTAIVSHELGSPELLVVTELSLFSLTRLAQLVPKEAEEEKILKRVITNQPVWIVEEGMELTRKKDTLPKPLRIQFEKAKEELRKWGVKFVTCSARAQVVQATKTGKPTPVKKELLTVAKIQKQKLAAGDTFHANPSMIITALAKDYLKDRGILIEMRNDG